MAVKENDELPEHIVWNVDTEVQLFYAMTGHKPVGVNKYFQMACILEKFRNSVNKDVSSKDIWDHLDTMYDMQALDDTENLPFPNDEKEFVLPANDFGDLMQKKLKAEPAAGADQEKEAKREVKKEVNFVKNSKDAPKKDAAATKEGREAKEPVREVKKETPKDAKKVGKEARRDSKDSAREVRKEGKKEVKDAAPKEVKQETPNKQGQRAGHKERKEVKKEDSDSRDDLPLIALNSGRKERAKDEETPKRGSQGVAGAKRATRGVGKGDDAGSSSPTPPPGKRRRT